MSYGSYLAPARTFLETHRARSITVAAKRLGISQPAASAHIRTIETLLQKQLFVREARGVAPTPAANALARSLAGPLDSVEIALASARARSPDLAGTVHLAGPAEFMSERMTGPLAALAETGIVLRIKIGGRDQLYRWLKSGTVDLAVTASVPDGADLGFAELVRENLLVVASPVLAERLIGATDTVATLRAVPLVAYDEDLGLVRDVFRTVFRAEADITPVATAPNLTMVARLAARGLGWTVLPDYIAQPLVDAGTLRIVPIANVPSNAINLVWNKGALRHPRTAFVRDHLLASTDAP